MAFTTQTRRWYNTNAKILENIAMNRNIVAHVRLRFLPVANMAKGIRYRKKFDKVGRMSLQVMQFFLQSRHAALAIFSGNTFSKYCMLEIMMYVKWLYAIIYLIQSRGIRL